MNKTLAILSIFLLAVMSIASATMDLSVDSIAISPSTPIEGQSASVTVTVSNAGDENITVGASGLTMNFDDGTTSAGNVPALNVGETKTMSFTHTYATHNNYLLIATYTIGDSNSANDVKSLAITVDELNVAPVVSTISNAVVTIGTTYNYNVVATDANGDTLTYSLSGQPTGMNINSGTGAISWTPTSRVTPTTVTVTVSDGSLSTSRTFSASTVNDAPVITPLNNAVVNVGTAYTQNVVATDANGDSLTYSLTGQPTGMSINSGTGVISWTPTSAISTTTVTVRVSDGLLTTTATFTARAVNIAPVIAPINNAIIVIGNTYTHNAVATDANPGDTLTFSITGPTDMSINSATGVITWTPTSAVANTIVTVSVSDGSLSASTTFTASARIDRAEISFVGTEIILGGSSYGRGDSTTKTIEVENTGTRTITGLTLDLTNTRNTALASNYNAYASISKTTLAPGEKAVVSVSVTIPDDANARKTEIGKLKVTGYEGTIQLIDDAKVYLEAEGFLEITNIDIYVNNKDEGSLDDGDTYDDIFEGDTVKLVVTVENTYNDKDFDINNVYVDVTDDNWDIDETSEEKDIKGEDDTTFTLEFTIDDLLDDDTTTLLIEAFGEDNEDDYEQYDVWDIDFEIQRKNDDVRIKEISFDKNPVDCKASSVTMEVTLRNYGDDDQDEVFIYAYSDKDELDWNKKETYLSIDSGDEITRSFVINLPKNVDEDTYIVNVEVKYDISKDADKETALLDVVCYNNVAPPVDEEDTDDTTTGGNIIITPGGNDMGTTGGTIIPTGNVIYGQPKSNLEKFTESTAYIVVLAVLGVIGLGVIVGWVGSALRK